MLATIQSELSYICEHIVKMHNPTAHGLRCVYNGGNAKVKRQKGRIVNIEAIREDESGKLFWHEVWGDCDMKNAIYLCDPDTSAYIHSCVVSVLYDDNADSYIDDVQDGEEESLDRNELYVVTYYEYDDTIGSLENRVDFGLTKEEVLYNVKDQRYKEGASYYTIGSVLRTTREKLGEYILVNYKERYMHHGRI